MRDTNMGFIEHLAEQEEYLKHPDPDDEKYSKIIIQSKEEIQSQVRQAELFDYYGIHIFDCDGYGRITADENIAVKCILDDKQVPSDVEQRLLKQKKDNLKAKWVRQIQQEIEEYYGIPQVGFDTDIAYDADDIEAIKYISMGKQLPVDLEQRLLQRKKDRILNNKYSEIKK